MAYGGDFPPLRKLPDPARITWKLARESSAEVAVNVMANECLNGPGIYSGYGLERRYQQVSISKKKAAWGGGQTKG
jgi:hypothetical protein